MSERYHRDVCKENLENLCAFFTISNSLELRSNGLHIVHDESFRTYQEFVWNHSRLKYIESLKM